MKRIRSALAVAVLLSRTLAAQARELERADLEPWLDGYFDRALPEARIAGAVVVVVASGSVVLAKGYGASDVATSAAVDPDRTLFRLGSISKLFTAVAALQLVERGRLSLDDPVDSLAGFEVSAPGRSPITLRHLLTHTAGFEDVLQQLLVTDSSHAESLEAYVRHHYPRPFAPPGSTPAYSNYGFSLVGYLVERASGIPFDDYMETRVLRPLGMTSATFRQPFPTGLAPLLSKGYSDPDAGPRPAGIYGPAPAGALVATGRDIGGFMIGLLNHGRLGETHLLDSTTVALMESTAGELWPGVNGMGLGFIHYDRAGRRIVGHDGGDPVFRSNLRLFPDDGVGLFVSFNSLGKEGGVFGVRTALIDGFIDRYFPSQLTVRPPALTARAHGEAARGWYRPSGRKASFFGIVDLLDQAEVVADSAGLLVVSSVTALNGQPKRWREIEPFTWEEVGGFDRLRAVVDGDRVVGLLRSGDPTGRLVRVTAWRSGAVLFPMLGLSVVVLALAAARRPKFWWPVAPAAGVERIAWVLSRGAAILVLVFVGSWAVLLNRLGAGQLDLFADAYQPLFRLIQVTGLLGALGGFAAAGRLVAMFLRPAAAAVRVGAMLLLAAWAGFGWFGIASGWLSQSLRY